MVVSLSGKPRLKRILHALATTPTNGRRSADDLIAAGWPERRPTKALEKAARNRLHVAIAELRSLGLRDVLVRSDDGYHLENARCAAEPPT